MTTIIQCDHTNSTECIAETENKGDFGSITEPECQGGKRYDLCPPCLEDVLIYLGTHYTVEYPSGQDSFQS